MITVLIVDDQALIREGFRSLLDSEPDLSVVAVAEDGAQGLRSARELDDGWLGGHSSDPLRS
jgi:YesN/AraC family two-component response regulator